LKIAIVWDVMEVKSWMGWSRFSWNICN